MSADNFYVLRKHPHGGFTLVQGFVSTDDSDDGLTIDIPAEADQFDTVEEALKAYSDGQQWPERGGYPEYWCEYGLGVHPEIFEHLEQNNEELP